MPEGYPGTRAGPAAEPSGPSQRSRSIATLAGLLKRLLPLVGGGNSKPDRAIVDLRDDERYFGLENFGNTCYANSVLQCLYFCHPFRERVLEHATRLQDPRNGPPKENVLNSLAELFWQISSQKKKTGFLSPRKLVNRVKAENELFSGFMHQDAEEFLNFLLNDLNDTLEKEERAARAKHASGRGVAGGGAAPPGGATAGGAAPSGLPRGPGSRPGRDGGLAAGGAATPLADRVVGGGSTAEDGGAGGPPPVSPAAGSGPGARGGAPSRPGHAHRRSSSLLQELAMDAAAEKEAEEASRPPTTWVRELFGGKLVSEMRCLACERVTRRDEDMYALALEVERNTSVAACLRNFSRTETLRGEDKFHCDACGTLQEAQKRIRVGRLPKVLLLHLKRFKYVESLGRLRKITSRVVFPFTLALVNAADDAHPGADCPYELTGVVVHVGTQPSHGHYVALVRSGAQWVCFDDDAVTAVTEAQVRSAFGSPADGDPTAAAAAAGPDASPRAGGYGAAPASGWGGGGASYPNGGGAGYPNGAYANGGNADGGHPGGGYGNGTSNNGNIAYPDAGPGVPHASVASPRDGYPSSPPAQHLPAAPLPVYGTTVLGGAGLGPSHLDHGYILVYQRVDEPKRLAQA